MIKTNQKYLNIVSKIADMCVLFMALIFAYFIRFSGVDKNVIGRLSFSTYMELSFYLMPLFFCLYLFYGLYKPKRRTSFYDEFLMIVRSNIIGFIIILSVLFFQKEVHYSRWVLIIFAMNNIILMTTERGFLRLFLRSLRRKGFNIKHVLVIGAGDLGKEFGNKIIENPELGYNIVGFLDNKMNGKVLKEIKVLGKISKLEKILSKHRLDEAIIALPLDEYKLVGEIIEICEKSGVKTQIIPAYQEFLPAKPYVDNLDGVPLINIRHIPLDEPLNKFVKRTFDILFSIFALFITSPVMVVVAILIKLTSPGPIIFKQERIGLDRKRFMMYKFRSMKVQKDEDEVTMWTKEKDPRKTKLGSFIRKTSIDELPQFFNVLKGDMSIIGPRPERPYFVKKFKEEIPKYMIKHHVRPGITGYAQANGWRGDTSIKKRIEHDIYYIENWSLGLDIQIIFRTIIFGFVNRNAY